MIPARQGEAGETFDVLVIGSSPLLLLEALYLEREGRTVAVVEKRSRLGGAWSTRPLWEFESVEIACHYIERGRRGYAFLQEYLGLALRPQSVKAVWMNTDGVLENQPLFSKVAEWIVRKVLWGRFLSGDAWGVIKGLERRDPYKCARALRRTIVAPAYQYPVGGARALLDALARRVAASSITLMDRACVEHVVVGADGSPHRCRIDGRTYQARCLVVGRHAYPRLRMSEDEGAEVEPAYAVNVLLRIAGEKAIPFEYFEIYRNDLVNRVADVSTFAHPHPSGARSSDLLVCCNLTEPGSTHSEVDPKRVFTHLVELGCVKSGARLVDSHVERYPNPETKESEPNDSIRVFNTYDLGVGLERNADRWRSLLRR